MAERPIALPPVTGGTVAHFGAFDPDVAAILVAAYNKALADLADADLADKGQPDLVQETIAKRIIALATEGERDRNKLCAAALQSLGVGTR
jgi:hypothetical protein